MQCAPGVKGVHHFTHTEPLETKCNGARLSRHGINAKYTGLKQDGMGGGAGGGSTDA